MNYTDKYPPAHGVYTPSRLPEVISGTQSPLWTYSEGALKTEGDLRPFNPARIGDKGLVMEMLTKEELLGVREGVDCLKRATPNDRKLAFEGDLDQVIINAQPSLFGDYGHTAPLYIYLNTFYMDRLRAEPGTLAEIFARWKEELDLRENAVRVREAIWTTECEYVQSKVGCKLALNRGRDWEYRALIKEGDWIFFEQKHLEVMSSFLRDMARLEEKHQTQRKNQEKMKEMEEAKAERDRKRIEEKERRAALEKEKLEQEQERKEQARLAAEQAEKERQERQAATAAEVTTMQMTAQAKVAAFQQASAALTAEFTAGKITAAEYGEKMAAISAILK